MSRHAAAESVAVQSGSPNSVASPTSGSPHQHGAGRADRAVLRKELRERAVPALVLGVALSAVAVAMFLLSQSLATTLAEISEAMPTQLISFIGGDVPGGYAIGELFSLLAPLALVGYAVMTGASAAAGEEETGSAGMVLGTPLRRSQFLLAKGLAVLIAITSAAALFWLGSVLTTGVLVNGPTAANITATVVQLLALAIAFGSLAFALGAGTGRPTIAAGTAGFVAALSYISASVLPIANLDQWARLSPWYYYNGSQPLNNGVAAVHLGVLVTIAVGCVVVAFVAYNKRDLRG
jgi:ABC-2 type transport system permease protein